MRKMTAKQKQQLLGLLDWFFTSLEDDTGGLVARRPDAKGSGASAGYNVEDLGSDSMLPLPPPGTGSFSIPRQHVDASATGDVPAGFVPTSAMNARPTANGSKTDAAMVKRI